LLKKNYEKLKGICDMPIEINLCTLNRKIFENQINKKIVMGEEEYDILILPIEHALAGIKYSNSPNRT